MTLNTQTLQKLVTPKPLAHMTTRLPTRFAKTNAALIAGLSPSPRVTKAKEGI